MPRIATRFESPDAQKYLTQMCKHFAHKIDVTFEGEDTAYCAMPQGPAELKAGGGALGITMNVTDPDRVQEAIFVIEIHLLRFAWREVVDLTWHETDTGAAVRRTDKLEAALKDQRDKNAARQKEMQD